MSYLMLSELAIRSVTSAFYDEGLDDHQWEAFFMGYCTAHADPASHP